MLKGEAPPDEISQEMLDALNLYVSTCREISRDGMIEVMTNVPGTAAEGEVGGTADFMAYDATERKLFVVDLKYGRYPVHAEDNAQLKLYALGAFLEFPQTVDTVECIIVQPRAFDGAEPVKRFEFDAPELLAFYDDVLHAVERGEAEKPEATPGEHCRWCKAAAVCPAFEVASSREARAVLFDGEELPAPGALDGQRLSDILALRDKLSAWFKTVEEYVETLLMSGGEVPGWKVVEKIGRRKIIEADEDIVAYAASFGLDEDAIRPRKLATLTEITRMLKASGAKKADLDEFELAYTIKESSGLTIAPQSDRREAVSPIASDASLITIDGIPS